MALIKCPECGKEISDQAKNCPGCGYKLNKSSTKKVLIILLIIASILILIPLFAFLIFAIFFPFS